MGSEHIIFETDKQLWYNEGYRAGFNSCLELLLKTIDDFKCKYEHFVKDEKA